MGLRRITRTAGFDQPGPTAPFLAVAPRASTADRLRVADDRSALPPLALATGRIPQTQQTGKTIRSPTTAATITMISTLGSSKLWLARTSATVKFRVPVLRASTRRVGVGAADQPSDAHAENSE